METGKDRKGCLGNVFLKSKGKLTVSEKKGEMIYLMILLGQRFYKSDLWIRSTVCEF